MGASPQVSLVIASRGRPDSLRRALMGVAQLYYHPFEVIVVGDPDALAAVSSLPFADRIKTVPFDKPNLSAARNLGVAAAAGHIVAFLDDDAVPEPTWLTYLVGGMQKTRADLAGGYVRGRTGISFQWRARSIDSEAAHQDLAVRNDVPALPDPGDGCAVKTEGTNMAIRRDALIAMGGFDEAFAFYLDDSDLNMRAQKAGLSTVLVPLAQVHHGSAPSALRTKARTPRDLSLIGRSLSVYLRKHAPADRIQPALAQARTAERARMVRHMVAGNCVTEDVGRMLRRFDEGVAEGLELQLGASPKFGTRQAFQPLLDEAPNMRHSVYISGLWQRRRMRAEALAARKDGHIVSLFEFTRTALFHSVRFTDEGIWLQRGGQFGRSERNNPLFQWWTRSGRAQKEAVRVAALRKPPHSLAHGETT